MTSASDQSHLHGQCCNGFRAGKQLAASCLHYVNCRLNPNSKPWTYKSVDNTKRRAGRSGGPCFWSNKTRIFSIPAGCTKGRSGVPHNRVGWRTAH